MRYEDFFIISEEVAEQLENAKCFYDEVSNTLLQNNASTTRGDYPAGVFTAPDKRVKMQILISFYCRAMADFV